MMKTKRIDGYKVRGCVLIPNGTGPRKAYILVPGYLVRPVTSWFHRNADMARLLPHTLKTQYRVNPFAWRQVFKQEGKKYRETVWSDVSTYGLAHTADGGYPLLYMTTDSCCLCATCATEQATRRDRESWPRIVGVEPFYEGPPIQCDNCNVSIESAYGDPAADNT